MSFPDISIDDLMIMKKKCARIVGRGCVLQLRKSKNTYKQDNINKWESEEDKIRRSMRISPVKKLAWLEEMR